MEEMIHGTTQWEAWTPDPRDGDRYSEGRICATPDCDAPVCNTAVMGYCIQCANKRKRNAIRPGERVARHRRYQAVYQTLAGSEWNEEAHYETVKRLRREDHR